MNVIDYGQYDPARACSAFGPNVSCNVAHFEWKPLGRGRKFERAAHALARRMRLPWVRQTLYERANPHTITPYNGYITVPTYGAVWTSNNALTNFSFACTCHKRERYSRKKKHVS